MREPADPLDSPLDPARREGHSFSLEEYSRPRSVWDADADFGEVAGEQWLALLPQKWNPPHTQLYGWRYDPRPRQFAAAPAERDECRRGRGATHATE